MRCLALVLLVAAGCAPADSTSEPLTNGQSEPLPKPGRAPKRDVCPGNHCWGIHSFKPPSSCDRCGAGGLPTSHHLCEKCAKEQGRCPHCSGKLPEPKAETPSAPPPPVAKKEPPPPREPDPPPVPAPQEPKPPEPPKVPAAFKLEDVKGENLMFDKADPGGNFKFEHSLAVFACTADQFKDRLAKVFGKEATPPPPNPKPTDDLVLYVLWGDRLGDPAPSAIFDRKSKRIVVTAKWSGGGMMDTGTIYRGYGFKLGPLEGGHYGAWVREATPVDKDGPKLTKSFNFTVGKD